MSTTFQLGWRHIVADSAESLAKTEVNDVHCCAFVLNSSHFITESSQVDQTLFTLSLSTLAVPT